MYNSVDKNFDQSLREILKNRLGNNNNGKGHKINIEFVSANPTGPIHIAHIRGAVLGDVLSSIYEKIYIIRISIFSKILENF